MLLDCSHDDEHRRFRSSRIPDDGVFLQDHTNRHPPDRRRRPHRGVDWRVGPMPLPMVLLWQSSIAFAGAHRGFVLRADCNLWIFVNSKTRQETQNKTKQNTVLKTMRSVRWVCLVTYIIFRVYRTYIEQQYQL